jgi:cysteine desulfurase family protein (TIGR01976 family)
MPELDLEFVRKQFPAFSEPSLKGFAHFENAGGSFACGQVIERLSEHYRKTKLQPYYDFEPSRSLGRDLDRARERLAGWLNIAPDELHFGPSTTQNTYVLGQAFRGILRHGQEIIVTNQDHEANIGAWRRLEADGIVIREWRVDPDSGELDPAGLDELLNDRTRLVAFTHCSNIVGSINPVRKLTAKIHAAGAFVCVDGVAYCPHGLPDVDALGADLYLFSLYKVYGPHLGVMAMRRSINEWLPNQGHFFNADKPAARFTPAGPDHVQIAAVNGVVDYLETVHDHHFGAATDGAADKALRVKRLFQEHEHSIAQALLDFIAAHPRTRLIGKAAMDSRAPTVSFAVTGQRAAGLASKLGAVNIGVGVGHCYARRLIEALGLDPAEGVLRASLVHYTSEAEVDRLIASLDSLL